MFLSATTQSLEIDLNAVVAANQLPVVASYVDVNQSTFAMSAMTTATTQTNSTTAVTIVAAPGATTTRQIKFLSIKNSDTSPVLLWVQVNDNATLREVTKCTLAVNDSLIYTDTDGWKTLDANGAAKYSQSGVAVASGKTLTISETMTLTAGAAGQTFTLPATSATIARTDAGQTFTGTNTFGALTLTGNVGVTGTPSFTLTGCSFTAGALVGTSLSTGSGAISGGAISGSGDFAIATNKFTVASASGNTVVAGTLGVTGAITANGTAGLLFTGSASPLLKYSSGLVVGDAGEDLRVSTYNGGAAVTAQAVTVGVNDSGGTGYRVLRIPN